MFCSPSKDNGEIRKSEPLARCRLNSHLVGKICFSNIVYDHTLASFSYLNEQRFNYQMMTVSYGAMMAQGG